MRILFVTPQLPWPARQGTALRNFHLLQAAARAHTVDLLSFDESGTGGGDAPHAIDRLGPLGHLCRRVETVPVPRRRRHARLRDLLLGRADMERRLWSPAFQSLMAARLATEAYDAVQLEGFEVAGYLLGPAALRAEAFGRAPWQRHPSSGAARPVGGPDGAGQARRGLAPRLIFDDHNAEYQLQDSAWRIDGRRPQRWLRAVYSALQARRLRAREALYCAAADACLAVSEEDAAALEAVVPGLGAVVVPNGVDVGAMPPATPGAQPEIFFAGKLDYRPNVDACEWLVREILPRVQAEVPAARVVLAGRDPAPEVRALAGPAVEVTGALSDAALASRRAEAWVAVVPTRMGSGVRFKALEAMAAGVPLVATPLGAAGSGVVDGEQALIAEDGASFAAAVVCLLRSPERRQELAARARRLAMERHDWDCITPRLLDLYRRLERPPRQAVSTITTVLNERASSAALLRSLARQSRVPEECVVVDGGSTDGTPSIVEACAAEEGLTLRLAVAAGSNISEGRNLAVGAARHELLAATDAGVVLSPDWLERLIAPLERDPRLQVVSGFFVAAPQSTWELALGVTTLPHVEEIDPARFLPSSRSVAFRRQAWQVAGGYPEWLDYCEDLLFDFALRRHAGPLRFAPRATVQFRPRPTPGAFFRQYYRYARGDGKANLWPRRHAVRYGAYLAGAALLGAAVVSPGGVVGRGLALGLLGLGVVTYLRRPFVRLSQVTESVTEFGRAALLVPLVRVTGDVAKMLGYPAGIWWRLRRERRTSR